MLQQTLWKISGGDAMIIPYCDARIRTVFSWLGVFVLTIFLLTLTGFFFSLKEIFEIPFDGGFISSCGLFLVLLLALFFALVISNIYLLLISTFSKNKLPIKRMPRSRIFSWIIRFGFLMYIGILVSKPVELLLIGDRITNELVEHREKEAEKFPDMAHKEKIRTTSFFAWKLQQLSFNRTTSVFAWFTSAIFVILYCAPVLVKMLIPKNSSYYLRKGNIEKELIEQHYGSFKQQYEKIFGKHTGKPEQFYEPFLDPPYNTERKKDERLFGKQDDSFFDLIDKQP